MTELHDYLMLAPMYSFFDGKNEYRFVTMCNHRYTILYSRILNEFIIHDVVADLVSCRGESDCALLILDSEAINVRFKTMSQLIINQSTTESICAKFYSEKLKQSMDLANVLLFNNLDISIKR